MTTDRAPRTGTVTAPVLPLQNNIQCRVAQVIGKASYSWLLTRLLPMLPHEGTEKLVRSRSLRQVFVSPGFLGLESASSEFTDDYCLVCSLFSQLKCAHLVPAKVPLLKEAIFNRNKVDVEGRWAARKVQHKEREITKRNGNDNRIKRRKAGDRDVSTN
jgi:hypothetical protein